MRRAVLSDVDALFELEASLFPEDAMNEVTLKRELLVSEAWVEDWEGEIIGYVLARHHQNLIDVTRLGVIERYRRNGVGSKLLEKAAGKRTMLMAKKENDPALKLYLQAGFSIVGTTDRSWVLKR